MIVIWFIPTFISFSADISRHEPPSSSPLVSPNGGTASPLNAGSASASASAAAASEAAIANILDGIDIKRLTEKGWCIQIVFPNPTVRVTPQFNTVSLPSRDLTLCHLQHFKVSLNTSPKYCVALKQSLFLYFLYLMELVALSLILAVFLYAQEVSRNYARNERIKTIICQSEKKAFLLFL